MVPSVMLRKLAAYRRQNQLDLALQELGRIERTVFMLDWLESPELRRRCHAGLNKSEQRHFLAQASVPSSRAGSPTAAPRHSSFAPPASTLSSPRSCSGTPPILPMRWPTCMRPKSHRPIRGSPIHRR